MQYRAILAISAILLAISACNSPNSKAKTPSAEEPNETQDALERGNEIAFEAQGALMSQVSSALQQGGTQYAIGYCNLKASGIADSIGALHNAQIGRIATRNRNPNNYLKNATDSAAYQSFEQAMAAGTTPEPVLKEVDGERYFYKPIVLKMEACLKCHGTPGKKVQKETLEALAKTYPNDKALGFEIGDLRGAWKIKLE